MPHIFPTFAKIYGWAVICFLFNRAFLAYFYPDRIFGNWELVGRSTYKQYEQANWMFASRNLALAMLGVVAQLNPPKWTGCIYLFSSFWIINVVNQLCDVIGVYWYYNMNALDPMQLNDAGNGALNAGMTVDGTFQFDLNRTPAGHFMVGTLMKEGQMVPYLFMALSCFALHQCWAVAYPDIPGQRDMDKKKKEHHKLPMMAKVVGGIDALGLLIFCIMWWWFPESNIFEGKDTEFEYKRWRQYIGSIQYLDQMVVLIGNRTAGALLLGHIAMWKNGCQARFAIAFFMWNAIVAMLDAGGALEYFEEDGRRWGGLAMGIIFTALNAVCIMQIHKKVTAGEKAEVARF